MATLVAHCYECVRRDPELGAMFNPAVQHWPAHQALLTAFHCPVARGTRSDLGSPVTAHSRHPVRAERFERRLALWRRGGADVFEATVAARMTGHAERIGHRLKPGQELRPESCRRDVPMPGESTSFEPACRVGGWPARSKRIHSGPDRLDRGTAGSDRPWGRAVQRIDPLRWEQRLRGVLPKGDGLETGDDLA